MGIWYRVRAYCAHNRLHKIQGNSVHYIANSSCYSNGSDMTWGKRYKLSPFLYGTAQNRQLHLPCRGQKFPVRRLNSSMKPADTDRSFLPPPSSGLAPLPPPPSSSCSTRQSRNFFFPPPKLHENGVPIQIFSVQLKAAACVGEILRACTHTHRERERERAPSPPSSIVHFLIGPSRFVTQIANGQAKDATFGPTSLLAKICLSC